MPRYFFHFRNQHGLKEDYEGDELADLAAVEETAMASAREIIANGLLGEAPVLTGYGFEVRDEAGALVLVFRFSEAAKPDALP
jgi:hypothetical protein